MTTGILVTKEVELKHLNQDLTEIRKWARNELYMKVKFLYRGEDELDSTKTSEKNSKVYRLYVKECQEKLPGVVTSKSIGPEYNLIYTQLLWQRATNESIIGKALSSGRSCSYTSMQNRFDGKLSLTD
jgi:hypothetical protein